MRKFLTAILVTLTGCMSLPVSAAEIVNAAFVFSGTPSDGDTVTVNGTTRTFKTTVTSASTQIEINGQNGSASNMYQHYLNYSETGLRAVYNATDTVTISTFPTTTISASESSSAIAVTLTTNSLAQALVVRVPNESVPDPAGTNRTYIANELADWLSDYNTKAIELPNGAVETPSLTFQNDTDSGLYWSAGDTWYLVAGGTTQLIIEDGTLTYTGYLVGTNANLVSPGLYAPVTTNLVNNGNAISSPGSGSTSEQIGTGSTATGTSSLAVGNTALASATFSTAVGNSATASAQSAVAVGQSATASGQNSVALGTSADALTGFGNIGIGSLSQSDGTSSIAVGANADAASLYSTAFGYAASAQHTNTLALGAGATANYSNSVAIGRSATTTADHQVRIGTSAEWVSIPGDLDVDGQIYEATIYQTEFPKLDNTSLSSGNNAAVSISTNSFVRIPSGPGAAFTINGVAGGVDGRQVTIYNATSYNMTIANDSGTDPTAANRIYTLTGSDYSTTGTGAVTLIYDSSASRWILISKID